MKLIPLMLVLLTAPFAAFGSGLVCSNATLYSSAIRYDFGTPPPSGIATGKTVIVHDGKVLLNHTSIAGLRPHGAPPYRVTLEGNKTVLEKKGNSVSGYEIFRQIAVLTKVNSVNPSKTEEISRGEAVCLGNWAMVP